MEMTVTQSVITIVVVAAGTFLTRLLPFVLFPQGRRVPPVVRYLGQVLPYAVVAMLVVYCLKDAVFTPRHALPELLGILSVIILHKLFHSMMFSVVGGTVIYMLLLQLVFSA